MQGFEIHSNRIWDENSILRALDFMVEVGMDALVLHQVDIIDHLVFPEKYFGEPSIVPGKWPKRPLFVLWRNQRNHVPYMKWLIERAHSKGVKVFLEVKEPWYPEVLLYVHPELLGKGGEICPSNPFWFEFLRAKIEKLLEVIPDLDGIVESLSTVETKVSLFSSNCECTRCQQVDVKEWYRNVISAVYEPLHKKGKELVVRDFAYLPEEHRALIEVIQEMPSDIALSLKNTPHDYYPTFPHNPHIGKVDNREQIIEFDGWGQYFGLGIFPCVLLEDFRERIKYAFSRGASGYLCRVDWEGATGGWILDSLNLINLCGLASFAKDFESEHDFESIVGEALKILENQKSTIPFLEATFFPKTSSELTELTSLLLKTWPIIEKSLYVKGFLFQHNSAFLASFEEARNIRTKVHPLTPWKPDQKDPFEEINRERADYIIAEKEEALNEVNEIASLLKSKRLQLSSRLNSSLLSLFEAFALYVEGFYLSAKAYTLTELTLADRKHETEALQAISALEEFIPRLKHQVSRYLWEPFFHNIYFLLDPEKVTQFGKSLLRAIKG
ncbi:MAG: hypothetical protein PWP60_834 [Candidatus Atribacteria bacterium]|nr:hypothetical protein [Candidatus Atribacteria bacterium]